MLHARRNGETALPQHLPLSSTNVDGNCYWHMENYDPHHPDAANPAMALWLKIEDQRRRGADPER